MPSPRGFSLPRRIRRQTLAMLQLQLQVEQVLGVMLATDAVREDWTSRRSDCTTRGARLRFYYDVPS